MEYVLRKLNLGDAQDIASAGNDVELHKYLRNRFPYPYSFKDARDYIKYSMKNPKECIFAIEIDGRASGCISATFRDDIYSKSCELGYWLAREYWGFGIMTAVVGEFCGFIFENYDMVRIDAEVFARNIGSRRVLEKNGFSLEGTHRCKIYKDGKHIDALTYALIRL